MLDTFKQFSMTLWDTIRNFLQELMATVFDPANTWVYVIGYLLTALIVLYIIQRLLELLVALPFTQVLKVGFLYLLQLSIYLVLTAIFVSLGMYLFSLYETSTYQEQKVVKQEQRENFNYLLK